MPIATGPAIADATTLVRQGIVPAGGSGLPPMLMLLHGVGSNPQNMMEIAQGIDPRYTVVMPRGPIALGPTQFAWFNVRFTPAGPVINADEARAAWEGIPALATSLAERTGADADRVVVGGFSQGGIIALDALLVSPTAFIGAVCMSGRLLPEVLPHAAPAGALAGKPVLIVHGTQDEKLGVAYARSATPTLRERGLDVTSQEFAMPHTVTSESLSAVNVWLAERLT